MDKKLLIDSYLEGKHPIVQEKWELPTESELDRDEALFDALLAECPSLHEVDGKGSSGNCRSLDRSCSTLHLVELQASAAHATR